ncbi:aspartate aminotransferase family protein [Psychromonas ossibalaenae]|uniref:aspartate aminotransferase family protein n=1 Tax=Psychromonas ossibalaenae TaxID=444922 RepID=UPI00036898CD|nr:aminotransferase class III-fold pyridoxal phosphate-dependent enzyme [Psychromonas ossibalaenae]
MHLLTDKHNIDKHLLLPGPKSKKVIAETQQYIGRSNYVGLYGIAIAAGNGNYIQDVDGHWYLDCLTGASCNILGYNTGLEQIYSDAAKTLQHSCFPYAPNQAALDLAKLLINNTPGHYPKKVLFGLSGSDAVEAAIQAMRKYTGRFAVVSFKYDYHGSTGLSQPASGFGLDKGIFPHSKYFRHFDFPGIASQVEQVLADIKTAFQSGLVGGVLVEPIQGDAGVITPAEGFLASLRQLASQYNCLYMVDEVQTGMGRSGRLWAIEHYNIEPDLLITAKGLSAGYVPVSAVIGRQEILDSLEPAQHVFTYSGHPPSCRVAQYVVNKMIQADTLDSVTRNGLLLKNKLLKLQKIFPNIIKEVRGLGLMLGMELNIENNPALTQTFCYLCLQRGVFFGYFGINNNVVRIEPPLTLTQEEIARVIEVSHEAFSIIAENRVSDNVKDAFKKYCVGIGIAADKKI